MRYESTILLEALVTAEVETLGDFQVIASAMRKRGWTKESVEYVVDRVWDF